jgi:hypothetical protein
MFVIPFLSPTTDYTIYEVRRLTEGLSLEGGQLAKKCKEFERMNRSVLAENRRVSLSDFRPGS